MSRSVTEKSRIAVIGLGNVGATTAYRLLISGIVGELVLFDLRDELAEGHARDLSHAVPLERPARVWAGSWEDCAASQVAILCAGVPQVPGESRLDLLGRNVAVLRSVLGELESRGFEGVFLVTTNPVDVLAYAAHRLAKLPAARVIGTGTVLDSARLRYLIGERLQVDPRSVHAYILGEHGDSEIAAWSAAQVGGLPLKGLEESRAGDSQAGDRAGGGVMGTMPAVDAEEAGGMTGAAIEVQLDHDTILERVRRAAPEIIARKGATYYAIASSIQRIVTAILRDERAILPVSTLMQGHYGISDLYMSTPCVVGREGVVEAFEVPLDREELEGLHRSAEVLRKSAASLRL